MKTRAVVSTIISFLAACSLTTALGQIPAKAIKRAQPMVFRQHDPQSGECASSRVPTTGTAAKQGFQIDHIANVGGISEAICSANDYIYLSVGMNLALLDASGPTAPTLVSEVLLNSLVYDVDVSGSRAHALTGTGLSVIDVANPSAPIVLAQDQWPGNQMETVGGFAYVATGGAVAIYDIQASIVPVLIGSIDSSAFYVDVQGKYAYAASDAVLRIIDVSTPSLPKQVGVYTSPTSDIRVVKAAILHVYLGDGARLRVIDASVPTNPSEVGSFFDAAGYPYGIETHGNLVVFVDYYGLGILDASTSSAPIQIGYQSSTTNPYCIVLGAHHAYVGSFGGNLRVFDISDSTRPHEVGAWVGPAPMAYDISLTGSSTSMLSWASSTTTTSPRFHRRMSRLQERWMRENLTSSATSVQKAIE